MISGFEFAAPGLSPLNYMAGLEFQSFPHNASDFDMLRHSGRINLLQKMRFRYQKKGIPIIGAQLNYNEKNQSLKNLYEI